MKEFGQSSLFVSQNADGVTSMMPTAFLALVVVVVIAFIILRYTMLQAGYLCDRRRRKLRKTAPASK